MTKLRKFEKKMLVGGGGGGSSFQLHNLFTTKFGCIFLWMIIVLATLNKYFFVFNHIGENKNLKFIKKR
jgi:hypothetical protein